MRLGWGPVRRSIRTAPLRLALAESLVKSTAVAMPPPIPGELLPEPGTITLNAGLPVTVVHVANSGDRPVQVGSHFHFMEANGALVFDRAAARGQRLDIPAGTAIRFEPGDAREVRLVPFTGARRVVGFRGEINGALDGGASTAEVH